LDLMTKPKFPLLAGRWLDLPSKISKALLVMGAIGIILVVSGSLLGKQAGTVGVDKVIHCLAYCLLGTTLILGLPTKASVAGLAFLALLSYLVEFLQPLNMRSLDAMDAVANTVGICLGAGLGLAGRLGLAWLWTELNELKAKKSLERYKKGEEILKEGERLERFQVIRKGKVRITRMEEDELVEVGDAGPGEPIGLIAEILRKPQPNSVTACCRTEVYELDFQSIEEAVGGKEQPVAKIIRELVKQLDETQALLAEAQT
jgi:hypothetical protein